jgi:hypothetical protein
MIDVVGWVESVLVPKWMILRFSHGSKACSTAVFVRLRVDVTDVNIFFCVILLFSDGL